MTRVGLSRGVLALVAVGLASTPAWVAPNASRVVMKAAAFEPQQVTVHVGEAVEWVNEDIVAHTATARDKSWEANVLPGRNGRVTMKSTGSFKYFCRYHPNMTGEVVVEP